MRMSINIKGCALSCYRTIETMHGSHKKIHVMEYPGNFIRYIKNYNRVFFLKILISLKHVLPQLLSWKILILTLKNPGEVPEKCI